MKKTWKSPMAQTLNEKALSEQIKAAALSGFLGCNVLLR